MRKANKHLCHLLWASALLGTLSSCQLVVNSPEELHRAAEREDEAHMHKVIGQELEKEAAKGSSGIGHQNAYGDNVVHHAVKHSPKAGMAATHALRGHVADHLEGKVSPSLQQKLSPTPETDKGANPELTDDDKKELKHVANRLDGESKAKLKALHRLTSQKNKQGKTPKEIARDKYEASKKDDPQKEKTFWDKHGKTLQTVYYVLGIVGAVLGIIVLFLL